MGFDFMSVTLESPSPRVITETVTYNVKESVTARVARFFTRKDAPTATYEVARHVPWFHTVEVDDTCESEDVRALLAKLTDRYGYEIVSVVADVDSTSYEMVNGYNSAPTGDEVGTFLVALMDEPYRAAGVVNAVREYGFGSDLTDTWMDDHYNGEWESPAAYAENLVEDCYTMKIPDFVSIDWDDTADTLGQDYDYVTDPETGMVHVYWKH